MIIAGTESFLFLFELYILSNHVLKRDYIINMPVLSFPILLFALSLCKNNWFCWNSINFFNRNHQTKYVLYLCYVSIVNLTVFITQHCIFQMRIVFCIFSNIEVGMENFPILSFIHTSQSVFLDSERKNSMLLILHFIPGVPFLHPNYGTHSTT